MTYDNSENDSYIKYRSMIITCVIAMIVAIPDLTYTVFWFIAFSYMSIMNTYDERDYLLYEGER